MCESIVFDWAVKDPQEFDAMRIQDANNELRRMCKSREEPLGCIHKYVGRRGVGEVEEVLEVYRCVSSCHICEVLSNQGTTLAVKSWGVTGAVVIGRSVPSMLKSQRGAIQVRMMVGHLC